MRSRYYHSQMDMEIPARGEPYQKLPSCIVIFICDYDPFHQDLCCYTIENRCKESGEIMDDGTGTVFLNICGKNRDEISPELAAFLDFVHADLEKSQETNHDPYIKQLQESIQEIKVSREMGVRYVLFTEKSILWIPGYVLLSKRKIAKCFCKRFKSRIQVYGRNIKSTQIANVLQGKTP